MPYPLVPVVISLVGVVTGTVLSKGLKSPKAIVLFYVNVAKSCYKTTGSKRIACLASLKGENKLETSLIGG